MVASDDNPLLLEPIQQLEEDDSELKNQIVESSLTKRFNRWRDKLGRTLVKSIYRGYDCETGREVQWNRIPLTCSTAVQRQIILKDIRTMKALEHRNVLTVVDSWVNRSRKEAVYITESFGGWTLRRHLQKLKKYRLRIVKGWALQILTALDYLHSKGIVHRSVRCDNIYIDTITNDIKLGEVGLALGNYYNVHPHFGRPEWAAPENFEDLWTSSGDIYSFGMTLLEIVTGRNPYSECANYLQLYRKIYHCGRPQAIQELQNNQLKNIISSCIGKDRPTARQLLQLPFWRTQEEIDNHPVAMVTRRIPTQRSFELSDNESTRPNKRSVKIQTDDDEAKVHPQKSLHHVEKKEKEGDTVFIINSQRNRKLELKIPRSSYDRQEYDELVSFVWAKLEDSSPRHFQRDEQTTTAQQTKSYFDTKRLEMLCQSRAKQDSCHQRLHYEELTNDLLGKLRERFATMYESYRQSLDSTYSHNLPEDILQARHSAERKQLDQQHLVDKDRRRSLKRCGRVFPYPTSESSVTNLIDILNNDGYVTTATDEQDRQATFIDIIRNDQVLTFNFDMDAWDELKISFHEHTDKQEQTLQQPLQLETFKSVHEIFVIRESGEEKSESKSKESADLD